MKRSSNGESTIYEDKVGRWHGEVWMGLKEGGAPDRRHVSGKTRAIVAQKVRELQVKRDGGQTARRERRQRLGSGWTTG
jgi:integrase